MADDELKKLVKKLLRGDAAQGFKEYLRFNPGSEGEIVEAFALFLQGISKKATNEGIVSVAAVQALFKESYRKRSRATQYFPAWVSWQPITDGMNKMLEFMQPDLRQGGGADFGPVLMAFFHGVAEHVSKYNGPGEELYADVCSTCKFAAMALQNYMTCGAVSTEEKRRYVQEIRNLCSAAAYKQLALCDLNRLARSMEAELAKG